MLTNFFILAYRNMRANKVASVINIAGLSIAVSCAIAVFLILKNFWTLDDFHVNGDRIFMVEYTQQVDSDQRTYGDAPAPIATSLASEFPQVKQTVRINRESVTVFHKESVINELITYADTNFFQVFTFPLQYGDPAALSDPTALILSHEMAEKYFPGQIPIGQPFTVVTANRENKQFVVRGIAQEFPTNVGLRFSLLTGYHSVHGLLKNQDWKTHISGVFVELHNKAEITKLAGQMNRYVAQYNARNQEKPINSFVFDNLRDPAANAHEVYRRPAEANDPLATILFSAMALVMMAVSCINYVNISLGGVSRRLKEIGMRKVLGSTRLQLIGQFMVENLVLCAIALGLGLLITQVFLIPLFNDVMVMTISLSFNQNWPLWLFLVGSVLFTGVASGAYPALYVSAFQPIVVFAGKQRFGNKRVVARVLLIGQFALAFIAVIIGVVLPSAGMQWKKLYWGYNPDQSLVLRLTDSTQYTILKNELAANASVQAIAGAETHVGESMDIQSIWVDNQEKRAMVYGVSPDYLQTLGLELAAGSLFNDQSTASNKSVLINETFVNKHGLKEPVIGKTMRLDSQLVTVAGVVKDFKLYGSGAVRPALFRVAAVPAFQYLVVRFEPGSGPKLVADIERIWKARFPHIQASHFYQKDVFEHFYTSVDKLAISFGYIAGLALLIACMGLYGLATQHFVHRVKEVSVRKVLGASVSQVILLVNREFITLLLIACLLANVLCYAGIELLLQNAQTFTGPFQLDTATFLIANALVFATAAIAVATQSWKMANVQLAETLRNNE